MKYLKRFNESIDLNKLRYFCETGLSYLFDDGLEVSINDCDYDDGRVEVILSGINDSWDQIKDQIIPFLIRLRSEYKLDIFFYGDENWNISLYIEEEGDKIFYNIDKIIELETLNYYNSDDTNYDILTISAIKFLVIDNKGIQS